MSERSEMKEAPRQEGAAAVSRPASNVLATSSSGRTALGGVVLALALFGTGCAKSATAGAGPEAPPTTSGAPGGMPEAGAPGGPPRPATVVTNEKGEQYATVDTPSSGSAAAPAPEAGGVTSETPAARAPAVRPEISAGAKEAHRAGLKAFSMGDLAGAKTQFSKAIQEDGKAYQAHYSLGVVEERLGAPGNAISNYKKAISIVPDYEPAIVAYALVMANQGNVDRAESYLRDQLGKIPGSPALLAALAEVYSIKGRSGDAQDLAQQALKRNPNYKPAMVTLARDHYRNRRLDLALYALRGILDGYGAENPPRDKNNAEALLIRGLIYKERNQRGPAIEEFEKAIALRPDLVEARLQLATYMLEAGNASGALPHLEAAVRYDNDNVLAHLNLGDAYRLLDRPADARRELEWVVKAQPNLAAAHYNLGLLYLLTKDMPGMTKVQSADKAIEHLEAYKARAVRGGPDDTDELINRAKAQKAFAEEAANPPAGGEG